MTEPIHEIRKLTIEEVYQDLYKSYKKALFRIGQLNSAIDELTFENKQLEKRITDLNKPEKKEIRQLQKESEYIQGLLEKIKRLENQNIRLRQSNGELISKIISYEKQLQL